MKALVTGGAGFIGSHLADRMVRDGCSVTVLDNESIGQRSNVTPAARYLKGDATRLEDLEDDEDDEELLEEDDGEEAIVEPE